MTMKVRHAEHELRAVCPWCHGELTRSSSANELDPKPPRPGDLTLCMTCGEWGAFSDDLGLRKLSDDEMIEVAQDENCRKIRLAWVMTRADFLIGRLKARGVTKNDLARAIDSDEGDLHSLRGEVRDQWLELRALLRGLRRQAGSR